MITINWGILGAGNISGKFVHDLVLNNTENEEIKHKIVSVGCSSHTKGQDFIAAHKVTKENNEGVIPIVQSYDEFYVNKDIQAVYIGTPHVFHKEQVIQCLNNGLHVLCEKPFTLNEKDSKELFELAKEKNRYLMEGVWTRFLPVVKQLKSKVQEDKVLGDVFRMIMDFSFDPDLPNVEESSRIRDINLGAGALLDIGIYCLTYSRLLLDTKLGNDHTPFDFKSVMTVDPTDGVDYNTSMLFKYETGEHAILSCTNLVDKQSPFARIEGKKGHAELYAINPARLRSFKLVLKNGETHEFKDDTDYIGFIHEANAMAKDLEAGKLTSEVIPPEETLLVMGLMDKVRYEHGLIYPSEK